MSSIFVYHSVRSPAPPWVSQQPWGEVTMQRSSAWLGYFLDMIKGLSLQCLAFIMKTNHQDSLNKVNLESLIHQVQCIDISSALFLFSKLKVKAMKNSKSS